jgi:hypothetical protein
LIITDKARSSKARSNVEAVGVMKGEELKHEEIKASHAIGGPYPHHTLHTGPRRIHAQCTLFTLPPLKEALANLNNVLKVH